MESKINFRPLKDHVICEWYTEKEIEGDKGKKIILTGEAAKDRESELNGVNEVLAVGPDVEGIKVGDWAMLSNMQVPILNIDGVLCADFKAHMIMGVFDEKPDIENCKNPQDGHIIRTSKTKEKAVKFAEKYKQ